MGLVERRALKQFEDEVFPKLKEQLDQAAHFEVPVEVDWQSLGVEGYGHLYSTAFPQVYFAPLVEAFQAICVDDMGREALQSSLKRVVICNVKGNSSPRGMASFEEGVLKLDHKPVTNIDDVKDRAKAIQQLLESSL